MKTMFFLVVLAAIQANAIAQSNFAHGLSVMRNAQIRAMVNQEDWETADKISLSPVDPEKPREEPQLDPRTLEQGQCGLLEYYRFRVIQVVDDKNVIIAIENPDIPWVLVADHDTSNLVDDERVRVVGMVDVGETKKYTTLRGGERTIRVIRLSNHEVPKPKPKTFKKAFIKSDGEAWAIGYLVAYSKGKVIIEDENGETKEILISKLSKEDRKTISDYVKTHPEIDPQKKRKIDKMKEEE